MKTGQKKGAAGVVESHDEKSIIDGINLLTQLTW
jgi:hypothetical protein